MSMVQLRPMGIGDILDGSFRLYRDRFALYYLLGLLPGLLGWLFNMLVPLLMGQFALNLNPQNPDPEVLMTFMAVMFGMVLILAAVSVMLQIFTSATISYSVAEDFMDRRRRFSELVKAFLSRLPALILAYLIFFVIALLCTPLVLVFCLGLFLLIYFYITYLLVIPIIMIEGHSATRAFSRSRDLMRTRTEPGFFNQPVYRAVGLGLVIIALSIAVYFVSAMIQSIANLPFQLGSNPAANPLGGYPAEMTALQFISYAFGHLLSTMIASFLVPFGSIVWVLFYYDLRIRKEGLDLELMAEGDQETGEELEPKPWDDMTDRDDDSAWPLSRPPQQE